MPEENTSVAAQLSDDEIETLLLMAGWEFEEGNIDNADYGRYVDSAQPARAGWKIQRRHFYAHSTETPMQLCFEIHMESLNGRG